MFFKNIPSELRVGDKFVSQNDEITELGLRIQIVTPENLLKLDRLLLIEGFPGCGKTTLLKILTIKLLNLNKKVLYLPCFKINPNHKDKSFKEIIQDFALGANQIQGDKVEDFILVIDGLDESPFILSDRILKNVDKFANVIVSTRITFNTSLRSSFLKIAVAPFSSDERNEFFSHWFDEKSDSMKKSKELIKKYRDIDVHTRIPLIATIAVALIQRGFQPTTRAEIYRDRLDLLLSNWDKFRGVKRLQIDYPDAKKRFLMELAFRIHSDEIRTRKSDDKSVLRGRQVFFEELLEIYEDSLGKWGYDVSYQKIIDDLVLCGILIEERPKVYSFGHLTFQEHLVGEYISENFSVHQIAELLGGDWWKEPLNFYSSIKGDITKLIEITLNNSSFLANIRQIYEMSKFAPYTSPGAIDSVSEAIDSVVNSQNINIEDF